MKNNKHQEALVGFLKANPNSNYDAILKGSRIADIMLKKTVKDLQEEGIITANDEDGGYVYTGAGKAKEQPLKEAAQEGKKQPNKGGDEDGDLGPKLAPGQKGRNNDRYDFGTEKQLSKGRLVHSLVKKFIADNPRLGLAKVQEALDSKAIQPRFGIIEELAKARAHSKNKRDRYFLKDEEILKVANVKAAVTNQWTHAMMLEFLKVARKLGYKVQVSK